MAQGYKGSISLSELCALIYEGFGQFAVMNLVRDRQTEGFLSDIAWKDCEGCDWHTPFDNGSCLVCGGK